MVWSNLSCWFSRWQGFCFLWLEVVVVVVDCSWLVVFWQFWLVFWAIFQPIFLQIIFPFVIFPFDLCPFFLFIFDYRFHHPHGIVWRAPSRTDILVFCSRSCLHVRSISISSWVANSHFGNAWGVSFCFRSCLLKYQPFLTQDPSHISSNLTVYSTLRVKFCRWCGISLPISWRWSWKTHRLILGTCQSRINFLLWLSTLSMIPAL